MSDAYTKQVDAWVTDNQLTRPQADDLLAQKALFDANRTTIEGTHSGKCVGYINGEMLVADNHTTLLAQAKAKHPGRMTYFETIGCCLFEEF